MSLSSSTSSRLTLTTLSNWESVEDIFEYLEQLAAAFAQSDGATAAAVNSIEFARHLDSIDPFAYCKCLFNYPVSAARSVSANEDCIYLCGNSLGVQPKKAVEYVNEELKKWGEEGVEGHFRGARPWVSIDEPCLPLAAEIVGAADSSEIAICNSLSANLHLLLTSFYRPTHSRYQVLIEAAAFCSDHHIIRSQIALHNRSIEETLIQLTPREGETFLRTEDIIECIQSHASTLALVFLPGVQFYTGQAFEIGRITRAGHEAGAFVGWDLAHAVGNIPLALHSWQVDFAAWCSYKYLNSGPGAIGGLFLHTAHHAKSNADLPKLAGWWGQMSSVRFLMRPDHQPITGAQSYQLSNPPVLQTVCVQASLEVFQKAGGVAALREKSLLLTGYLHYLLTPLLKAGAVTLLTPSTLKDRGCQLSLLFDIPIRGILTLLAKEEGVIADGREPNVIRISPAPLYNGYEEIYKAVHKLQRCWKIEKERHGNTSALDHADSTLPNGH